MPQKSNQEAPLVMTWGKAAPVLIVAGIFDLVRMFFEMFWFFGPALAAVGCTVTANAKIGVDTTSLVGGAIATVCTTAAGVAGFYGAGLIESFGVLLSMAAGFMGFLVLGVWVLMTNSRIFKANATGFIWFMGSFAISEIPFIGALPAFTLTLIKLYRTQIRVERIAFAQYQQKQSVLSQREIQRQALIAAQSQAERDAEEKRLAQEGVEEEERQAERDARTEAALARAKLAEAEIADQTARGREVANGRYIPDDERLAT